MHSLEDVMRLLFSFIALAALAAPLPAAEVPKPTGDDIVEIEADLLRDSGAITVTVVLIVLSRLV